MNQNRNKKSIFVLIFVSFAFFSGSLKSQTFLLDPPEIYIGPTFGYNLSRVNFSPSIQQSFLQGNNGGLAFRYISEKHFGFQIELNYSQRGWTESDSAGYSRRLNYIEVPFLTHFYFGNSSRFIFNVGPKISYLLSEKVLKNDFTNTTAEQHIKPAYFPFDYGIAAGFGYDLHTRSVGILELELRIYYGLADVFANTKTDYFAASNHLDASINLGWFFQLSGKEKKKTIK